MATSPRQPDIADAIEVRRDLRGAAAWRASRASPAVNPSNPISGRSTSAFASSTFSSSVPMTSAASTLLPQRAVRSRVPLLRRPPRTCAIEARIRGGRLERFPRGRRMRLSERGEPELSRRRFYVPAIGRCGYHTRLIFPANHGRP